MRQPSIHITEGSLVRVLKKAYPKLSFNKQVKSYEHFAKIILELAKMENVSFRSVKITSDRIEKKIAKLKLSNRGNTSKFAKYLVIIRRKFHHKGVTQIDVGSQDWLSLKEVVKLATEFCNEFRLPLDQGYKQYITIGLSKMKSFSIYRFKYLHPTICNEFEAMKLISEDESPQKTQEIHDIYLSFISERIGYSQGYREIPIKYQYFVLAKREAIKHGVSLKTYVASQFAALEWASAIPDPMQLVGVKAVERLQKYAYEHSIKMGDKRVSVDFHKIKKGKQ